MTFSSVPIIVICCYVLGEIIKLIFKNRKQVYRAIPVILSAVGGILGVIIFQSNPEMLFEDVNIWIALETGMISGASATGANQIIKQIFFKSNKENDDNDSDT